MIFNEANTPTLRAESKHCSQGFVRRVRHEEASVADELCCRLSPRSPGFRCDLSQHLGTSVFCAGDQIPICTVKRMPS